MPVPRNVVKVASDHLAAIVNAVEPRRGAARKVDGGKRVSICEKPMLDVLRRVEVATDHLAEVIDAEDEGTRVRGHVRTVFQERRGIAALNDAMGNIARVCVRTDSYAGVGDAFEVG